jgi:hypothetical protein
MYFELSLGAAKKLTIINNYKKCHARTINQDLLYIFLVHLA